MSVVSRFRVHLDDLSCGPFKGVAANSTDVSAKKTGGVVPGISLFLSCSEVDQCLFHATDYSGPQYLRKTKNYPLTKSASVFTVRA